MSRLTDVCALASVEALKRYVDEGTDKPVAPLAELLVELLISEPELSPHGHVLWYMLGLASATAILCEGS